MFHGDLKELSFTGCKLIDLTDLALCTHLQSLRISSTCSLNSYENIPDLSADSFLPNLKSFSCKICLGTVSSLFEEKTTLNRLIMKCCHMDIQVLYFYNQFHCNIHPIRYILRRNVFNGSGDHWRFCTFSAVPVLWTRPWFHV